MSKLIVKTAVKTACIAIAAVALAFLILCFGFPQHMATFNERAGNYSAAVRYASLRYTYTGDGYDLARCVEDGILSGDSKTVVELGDRFIVHSDFGEVCKDKSAMLNFDYKQYVCGKLAVAKYVCGDFDGALGTAQTANGTQSFANGNALMTLCMRIVSDKDTSRADALLTALDKVTPANETEALLKEDVGKTVTALKG